MRYFVSVVSTSLLCLLIGCSRPTTSMRTPPPAEPLGTTTTRPKEPDLATGPMATNQEGPFRTITIPIRKPQLSIPDDRCPDGHTTLKEVPIVYGLLIAETPEARKALTEDIENYKTWPGGCVITDDSPKVRVTCTTCGFGFDAQFGHWSRSSSDPASFTRPFSAQTSGFPRPSKDHLEDALDYSQSVYQNEVMSESLCYTSTQTRDVLIAAISQWFKGIGQDPQSCKESEVTDLAGSEKKISEWTAPGLHVMLHYYKKEQECWVMLIVTRSVRDIQDKLQKDLEPTQPLPE